MDKQKQLMAIISDAIQYERTLKNRVKSKRAEEILFVLLHEVSWNRPGALNEAIEKHKNDDYIIDILEEIKSEYIIATFEF